jgi:hypothetical protein
MLEERVKELEKNLTRKSSTTKLWQKRVIGFMRKERPEKEGASKKETPRLKKKQEDTID